MRRTAVRLGTNVLVLRGATSVGIVRGTSGCCLIGSASPDALARGGTVASSPQIVLVTHADRDCTVGATALAAGGARVIVPALLRPLFESPAAFWTEDAFRIHSYHFHPGPRLPREPLPISGSVRGRDAISYPRVTIRAIDAPGPTDGGLAYIVEVDERKVAFVGDLLSGHGTLRDFWMLQGSRPLPNGGTLMEYHGFGERTRDVLQSLERVLAHNPDVLVPTHGEIVTDPCGAVALLRERIEACLASYYAISAGRWYFAGARPEWSTDRSDMEARCRPLPAWVRIAGGTSRVVVADDGAAFLLDCWGDAPDRIAEMQREGTFGHIEALWITHYHDDHVGRVNEMREREGCSVIGHESMIDILRRPEAWHMPCLDPNPITVDRVTRDRETWKWHEYRMTAFTCPGQTILDAALLVERGGERLLFVGDSMTPGGIDDYCALNRNPVGPGLGLDRCLELVGSLGPGLLLVNPHVPEAFTFTPDGIAAMRANLAERRRLFGELLSWDDPNYGLDPQWCRVDPYRQTAQPGGVVEWDVVIRNYSRGSRTARVGLRAPSGWQPRISTAVCRVPAGRERRMRLSAHVPAGMAPARCIAGFALRYGGRELGELSEGIVDVE